MRYIFVILLLCANPNLYAQANGAESNKMKEFLTSVTYGTLVGAMVGAASLAFEDEPKDKLQNIARGASLGLYAGIALGVYVTQFHGVQKELPPAPIPEYEPIPGIDVFYFEPLFNEKKLDGLKANMTILRF